MLGKNSEIIKKLIQEKGNEKLINLLRKKENLYEHGRMHYGTIGSGDIWTKDVDRIIELNKKYGINEILEEEYDKRVLINLQDFLFKLLKMI